MALRKTGNKTLLRDEVREKIIRMIVDDGMAKGERLLPEKELGRLWNVNHITIRSACAELVEKQILYKIPGHGTFFNGFSQESRPSEAAPLAGIVMMEEEHFFNQVRNHIVDNLQRLGCLCRISQLTGHEETTILPEIRQMLEYGVEHLIIMQTELEKFPDAVRFLEENQGRFKTITRIFGNGAYPGSFPGAQVTADYKQGFLCRIERLKKAGLKRIAYLGNNCAENYLAGRANRRFLALYSEAMIEAGLAEYITARSSAEDPAEIRRLLSEPVEAVICSTDYLAVKVYECARELGMEIPADLSLFGCYDTPWARHFQLSSMRLDPRKFASAVAGAVASERSHGTEYVKFELVERNSIK